MQNRYVGDIGDYGKYGLLRKILKKHRCLGIAWYLFPDETHNKDGKHIEYLEQSNEWRALDPDLYDSLQGIVQSGSRKVKAVEQGDIFPENTIFASDILACASGWHQNRDKFRRQWFEVVFTKLAQCDLIFADPDNGLYPSEKYKFCKKKDWKRLPLCEALLLAEKRTAIFYHHNTRRRGGHDEEIQDWRRQFANHEMPTIAIRWRSGNSRTFFIVNPTMQDKICCQEFVLNAKKLGMKTDLMDS